ncbi:PEP-CTERM sorting domain-containing protein [Rosistilla ulvae]|nr:PEP-CTERM sorting domain-containing protein [Rosistilla ulvae]
MFSFEGTDTGTLGNAGSAGRAYWDTNATDPSPPNTTTFVLSNAFQFESNPTSDTSAALVLQFDNANMLTGLLLATQFAGQANQSGTISTVSNFSFNYGTGFSGTNSEVYLTSFENIVLGAGYNVPLSAGPTHATGFQPIQVQSAQTAAAPEPGSLALMASGLAGAALLRRRQRRLKEDRNESELAPAPAAD